MSGVGTMTNAMSEAGTLAILRQACEVAGLNADSARLLRLGSNAVYRLTAPVVARIARPEGDTAAARRMVEVARWLESVAYPAVRAIPLDQPVVLDSHAVTFWEAVSDDSDEYATIGQVAAVIARLHKMTAPDDLCLPALEPFRNVGQRIAESRWLTGDDRTWMTIELGRLTREEYETFTRVYGYDLLQWPGYPVLAAVREFIMVTWMILKAAGSGPTSAEARKRLHTLRTGDSRKDWDPF
jgi:hypothetical protein